MRFEFATAGRIVFGAGVLSEAGQLVRETVTGVGAAVDPVRVLVVRGRNPARADRLHQLLAAEGIECMDFAVHGEPTVEMIRNGVQQLTEARHDAGHMVIGIGGGSVIDAGKAMAVLAANPGDPLDYLEVVGRGKKLSQPGLPCMAIPTTAGTGAEVTRNAVLMSEAHGVKVSLRSALMLPRVALVDSQLTYSLPPAVTAATGLDALTQLIEPFVSARANPMTDAICREGIARVARSLRRAFESPEDAGAREDMSLAGLFGGLTLANAGLGAVHGFAGPIGGMFPAPHGAVCAALLPHVMAANVAALWARDSGNTALPRYQQIAEILTDQPGASVEEGVEWARRLVADLQIPGLHAYGLEPGHADAVVAKAVAASSMKANPIRLTPDELKGVLIAAL